MTLDDLTGWLLAVTIAAGLCALGAAIEWADRAIGLWRLRRRLRKLPPPDDPRLRNLVSLRDWKNNEKAASRLRAAA